MDSWFLSCCGMNVYRGCLHDCIYCDGRAEKYQVSGSFGSDVVVKSNAVQLLKKQLERRRKPLPGGFVMVGGGVGDSYQQVEKEYELTRKILNLLRMKSLPVHLLTKSTLVLRDSELLHQLQKRNKVLVSCSFSCVDDEIASVLEPNVPPPSKRLEMLSKLHDEGFDVGMYLLPIVPFISDDSKQIDDAFNQAKKCGVCFVVADSMTLKTGRQMDFFKEKVSEKWPEKVENILQLYGHDVYGSPSKTYASKVHENIFGAAKKTGLPLRMPPDIYSDLLSVNELVSVIFDHLFYLLAFRNKKSSFNYASYAISKLSCSLDSSECIYSDISGVGSFSEKLIDEIVKTNRCKYYEDLLFYKK